MTSANNGKDSRLAIVLTAANFTKSPIFKMTTTQHGVLPELFWVENPPDHRWATSPHPSNADWGAYPPRTRSTARICRSFGSVHHRLDARLDGLRQGRPSVDQVLQVGVGGAVFVWIAGGTAGGCSLVVVSVCQSISCRIKQRTSNP